ncbi:MAG TPA: TonB-dependent receptor [Pseudomonadota bacterium]|nr:TonB-dependent receptor [Pseudomonadota bacterium]
MSQSGGVWSRSAVRWQPGRRRVGVAVLWVVLALLYGERAEAQIQNGQIQGLVKSDADGKPLPGVTVTVSGPALQGDQVEVTGADGRYLINQLPSGDDYVVRFYLGDTVVERPGVRIVQNKTLSISVTMPLKQQTKEVKVIRERAPNVDTATANSGLEINEDVLRNTAVRGRTFESVLALAPGTVDPPRGQGGDIGVSISGSTGNENSFIIDGLNTSDPNTGVVGTELHQYFIKEVNVITGGYQAEYGRATGGIISIVTKSGGNEFHGSVFGSLQPFQLQPRTVGRLGEALALRRNADGLVYDYGFELGGPIVKDRIWFFVGFAPTTTVLQNERAVRQTLLDPLTGQAQSLSDYQCPPYLATTLYCRGGRLLAQATRELDERTLRYDETRRLFNGVAKLQFNINQDHNITVGYTASPSTFDGYNNLSPFRSANIDDFAYASTQQVHDVSARYVGKVMDRRLQIELLYGYHYQGLNQTPKQIDKQNIQYLAGADNPYSLADFEDIPECRRQAAFNPCPITSYERNGFGQYNRTVLQRHQALAALTYFLNALGNHAFKLGFDFEHLSNDNFRTYSGTDADPTDPATGHVLYQTSADGQRYRNFAEYSTVDPATGETRLLDGFTSQTFTNNYALYLRDSWNISKLPGVVLNVGVRWEAQELFGADGSRQIGIYDNIAPRVGAVWDFTGKGLSKLYLNYGRFYESLPLTINDRQFSGEGVFTGAEVSDCPLSPLQPGGRPLPTAIGGKAAGTCDLNNPNADGANQNGGRYGNVVPGLKGQYLDEVVAGLNYQVGLDIVLGIGYIYRSLGNIVEDMSVDGGTNYLIGNPGTAPDPARVAELQARVASLQQAAPTPANQDALQRAQAQLTAYQSVGRLFPRAKRVYNALVLTANKRLSSRFSLIANYTYSRITGNYPGTFDGTVDENLPNFSSQYDLTDLLANRNGPLSNDRPHNLKLLGTYQQPIGPGGTLTIGLTFTAYSGRPINVLGSHPIYGFSQVFILPRGAGGRTPTVTQFDLHLGFDQKFNKRITLSVFVDVINLFNQRAVTNVDDDYTYSSVAPILQGSPVDLLHLKDNEGNPVVLNSNYGQPTGYQAPLYMRFGARLAF